MPATARANGRAQATGLLLLLLLPLLLLLLFLLCFVRAQLLEAAVQVRHFRRLGNTGRRSPASKQTTPRRQTQGQIECDDGARPHATRPEPHSTHNSTHRSPGPVWNSSSRSFFPTTGVCTAAVVAAVVAASLAEPTVTSAAFRR